MKHRPEQASKSAGEIDGIAEAGCASSVYAVESGWKIGNGHYKFKFDVTWH